MGTRNPILIILAIVFFSIQAHAFILRGGTPQVCLYTGDETVGSCVNPTMTSSQFLFTTDNTHWFFNTGVNTLELIGNIVSSFDASEAVFCSVGTYLQGSIAWHDTTNIIFGYSPWWSQVNFEVFQQQNAAVPGVGCNPTSSYFLVNGNPTKTLGLAFQAGGTTPNVEIKSMPPGIPFWIGRSLGTTSNSNGWPLIVTSGTTVTLDPGVLIYDIICNNGAGGICIQAANVTLNGAGTTVGWSSDSSVNEEIDILSSNPTIQGSSGNYFNVDCQGMAGQQFPGHGPSGVLSGHTDGGLITLSHVKIENCGSAGGGQDHGVYLGAPNQTFNDYCEDFIDVLVQDVGGDGPATKFDDQCGTQQGIINQSAVYCTIEGQPGGLPTNCSQNDNIDSQCGGWHLIENTVLEQYGQPGSNDNGLFSKVNWGPLGWEGCAVFAAPTNLYKFTNDVIIFDGHVNTTTPTLVCAGSNKGCSTGNANGSPDVSTTSTTSISVATGQVGLVVATGLSPAPVSGQEIKLTSGSNVMTGTVPGPSTFSGYINNGTTLTVTGFSNPPTTSLPFDCSGTLACGYINLGQTITGSGVTSGTFVVSQLTGTSGDSCPATDCNGTTGTYQISVSQNVCPAGSPCGSESMVGSSYNSTTGELAANIYLVSGSGSSSSWTVNVGFYPAVCASNNQLVQNDDNPSLKIRVGEGVFTDSGCSTTGTDTNVYYATRADACFVNIGFNWVGCNTAPYTNGSFPFVPSPSATMPTQAQQATAAAAASCSGSGTQASPYSGCT